MPQIRLTDEDAHAFREWQRLSPEAKDAGLKIAKLLGNEEKRVSFYKLLEMQSELSKMVAAKGHFTWFGGLIFRISALAAALLGIATFILVMTGKKIL